MARLVETKNAIQMGHLGNLAAIAAAIPDGNREAVTVGYIVGKASGLSYRANPNDPNQPSVGLMGIFEATPCDNAAPILVGKVIFLPKGAMDVLVPLFASIDQKDVPKKAPPKGKAIDLAATEVIPLQLEIGIRKNTGAGVGYEFAVSMPDTFRGEDMLADLRKDFIPASLAAPKTATPQLAAPARKGAKKKTK